jgi:hypothetical protein
VLYIDYNDGIFEEYPNEHFVVWRNKMI